MDYVRKARLPAATVNHTACPLALRSITGERIVKRDRREQIRTFYEEMKRDNKAIQICQLEKKCDRFVKRITRPRKLNAASLKKESLCPKIHLDL